MALGKGLRTASNSNKKFVLATSSSGSSSNFDNKVQNLSNTISKVNDMLMTNSMYPIYIEFNISGTSFITNGTEGCIMSLTNEKNGSGSANKFTIILCTQVGISASAGNSPGNINYIDHLLAYSEGGECTIRYGYDTKAGYLVTELYNGKVLDYTVELNSGLLTYTITGISSLVSLTQETISFSQIDAGTKLTDVFGAVVEACLPDYKFTYRGDTKGSDAPIEENFSATNMTVFEYLNSLANNMIHTSDYSSGTISAGKKITYSYAVDDVDKTIELYYVNVNDSNTDIELPFNWMARENNLVLSFSTSFRGATIMFQSSAASTNNSTFTYSESGSVYDEVTSRADSTGPFGSNRYGAFGGSSAKNVVSSTSTYGIGDDGNAGSHSSFGATGESGLRSYTEDYKSDIDQWARQVQASYKANITLVGIPCEIPIGTKIQITPIVYDQSHITSGTYMTLNVTDSIDSSGFITSIELFRIGVDLGEDLMVSVTPNESDDNNTYVPSNTRAKNKANVLYDPKSKELSDLLNDIEADTVIRSGSFGGNRRARSVSTMSAPKITSINELSNMESIRSVVITSSSIEDVYEYCDDVSLDNLPHMYITDGKAYSLLPYIKSTRYGGSDYDNKIYVSVYSGGSINSISESLDKLIMICSYCIVAFNLNITDVIDGTEASIQSGHSMSGFGKIFRVLGIGIQDLRKRISEFIDNRFNFGKDDLIQGG